MKYYETQILRFKNYDDLDSQLNELPKYYSIVMLFRLISLILSMVLETILSEFLRWALLLLWIRLKKRTILLTLKLRAMKSNNIWKIIIGAVSAALGYILNAIGL